MITSFKFDRVDVVVPSLRMSPSLCMDGMRVTSTPSLDWNSDGALMSLLEVRRRTRLSSDSLQTMIASASVPFHSASLYVGDLAADASEVRCAYLDVISVFAGPAL